ncbi:unnamed protein product [Protopolystoma xenopodis]|uniref:Uncharacterized protein n=1 Tax=Protopolystoma xenopodis TaxID=117903 RepID=A0A3S5CR01_9PLAT|nr:unnamed protein product [Protopolystoma xenopodis]
MEANLEREDEAEDDDSSPCPSPFPQFHNLFDLGYEQGHTVNLDPTPAVAFNSYHCCTEREAQPAPDSCHICIRERGIFPPFTSYYHPQTTAYGPMVSCYCKDPYLDCCNSNILAKECPTSQCINAPLMQQQNYSPGLPFLASALNSRTCCKSACIGDPLSSFTAFQRVVECGNLVDGKISQCDGVLNPELVEAYHDKLSLHSLSAGSSEHSDFPV